MQKLCVTIALLATMVFPLQVWAGQADAPDVVLKALTSEVLEVVAQDKDIQAGNARKMASLIEPKVVAVFDFVRMTQIAMAHNWVLATPEQQSAVAKEFQTLLIRTYSTVLTSYRNQTVEFKTVDTAPGNPQVTVKSLIRQSGSQPLTIDYQMWKTAAGWKVYEVRVDGVDLIANYRSPFATAVRDGGVDGLIRALRDKNRQSGTRLNVSGPA
jgi:phospholipid transport system substrate-binding protein